MPRRWSWLAPVPVIVAMILGAPAHADAGHPIAGKPPALVVPPPGWADCGAIEDQIFVSGSMSCAEGERRANESGFVGARGSDGPGPMNTPFLVGDMTCRGDYGKNGLGELDFDGGGCVAPSGQMVYRTGPRDLARAAERERLGVQAATDRRPPYCPRIRWSGNTAAALQQGFPCDQIAGILKRFRFPSNPQILDDPREGERGRSGPILCLLGTPISSHWVRRGRYTATGSCVAGLKHVSFRVERRATRAERRAARPAR